MGDKIKKFDLFLEGIKADDMSSLPGGYLQNVSARAKERMGIAGQREGDPRSVMAAAGPLMSELSRSQQLSAGHEEALSKLATDVITNLYKPLIDYYNIKLDIKFASGPEMRRMIDRGFARPKGNQGTPSQTPIIKARGADFSMLIHEAVKGMWRVLSMRSVPDDREIAKAIESQFNLMDEPDDWKYGPEIAADLRDFINENPKTDSYKNVREELWLFMINPKNISDDDFLELMKGILAKSPEARKKIDGYIDIVVKGIKERDEYLRQMEEYNLKMAEYERKMAEYEKRKQAKPMQITKTEPQEPEIIDYSQMTQRELNDELSKALDTRDFKKAEEIAKYLK